MRFLNPNVLWNLIWLLPLMILVFILAKQKTLAALKQFLGKNAENPDFVLVSYSKKLLRFILLLCAVVMLVVAWARPSWGVQIQEIHGQGRDLLVVFDTSKSMLAKDVQPSRLAHAKWLVKELVKLNPGDRFGLIAFAGKAFLECPLTTDKTSFIQSVDELSTETIPVGGTNIQAALETALRAFKAAETMHRAIVLITDGDELEGDSGKAVDEIIARKIPLFIAGIGDPSQPSIIQVPDGKGGFVTLKDNAGNIVNSPLNETSLGVLAKKTGGIYVRSTAGNPRLGALEKRIRALAPQDYESIKTTKPIDRFIYPLGLAILLLLIWVVISERSVRQTGTVLACAFFLSLNLSAQTPQGPLKTALPEPAAKQTENQQQEIQNPVELFNQGVEQQIKGEIPNAVKSYEEALASGVDNLEIRGRTSQNLGVISHTKARSELGESLKSLQGQQLDDALKKVEASLKNMDKTETMYRESMQDSTDHSAIAKNQSILIADRKKAEELKKKIEELKKAQQNAQQKTQQAKDQQNKENKQDQQKQKQNQNKQNQQNKQDQQSAQEKTEDAQKAAQDLKQKAQDLGQKNMEQTADQAKKELDKAKEEQQKGNGKAAEEHLKKALDKLGGEQNKDQKSGKDQNKQDQNKDSGKKDQNKQDQNKQKQNQPQQGQPQQPKPEEGDLDKNQAASILEDMSKDEKNLRDAIKAHQKQRYRNAVPAKDW